MKGHAAVAALALFGALAVAAPYAKADTSFANTKLVTQPDAKHTKTTKGTLTLDTAGSELSFAGGAQPTVAVPYGQITSMRLEQTVARIRTPFSGRVQHQQYLTLVYQDGSGKPAFAVFELRGKSYREVVAALEAETKKPVEWRTN